MLSLKRQFVILLTCVVVYYANLQWRTPKIPEHLLHHEARFVNELLTADETASLRNLIKSMGDFPSNNQDLEFYKAEYEDIGEADPIGADGKCPNRIYVPNHNRTKCILPGRVDIVKHFVKYGGVEGWKDNFVMSTSRLQSFARYIFDLEPYPVVQKLFAKENVIRETKAVCPKHKQILDPFQFNFQIQIPGQTVAVHLDGIYFEKATRFQYPQWLLAVMHHSGLYKDTYVDQVQVVAYLHEWDADKRDGAFLYYVNNSITPVFEKPYARGASIVDGAKVIHASTVYLPKRLPPLMYTKNNNRLVYLGDDKWKITANGETIANYVTDDLRLTIVFRARCFETEEKKKTFNEWYRSGKDIRPIEEIVEDLRQDLVRTRGYGKEYIYGLKMYDLAMLFLDEYIAYPVPAKAIIPFNYCLMDKLFPWTEPIVNFFC